jgi:predicted RNA methylase
MTTYRAGHVRHRHDQYFTPPDAVRPVLDDLAEWLDRRELLIVEPSVGRGDILRTVLARTGTARAIGIDIDRALLAQTAATVPRMTAVLGDYLALDLRGAGLRPDLVIGNPPYGDHVLPFVEKALREVADDGAVSMLLRLSWLETPGRASLHARRPARLTVLSCRPSFTNNGRTDGQAYAWFTWLPEGHPLAGTWRVAR